MINSKNDTNIGNSKIDNSKYVDLSNYIINAIDFTTSPFAIILIGLAIMNFSFSDSKEAILYLNHVAVSLAVFLAALKLVKYFLEVFIIEKYGNSLKAVYWNLGTLFGTALLYYAFVSLLITR